MQSIHKLLQKIFHSGDEKLKSEILRLRAENISLALDNAKLEKKVKNNISKIPVSGFDELSSEPSDTKERAEYVDQVSAFYLNIFRDKLRDVIAVTRHSLAQANNHLEYNLTREQYDYLLRGMESQCWAFDEWCQTLMGERVGDLEDNEEK